MLPDHRRCHRWSQMLPDAASPDAARCCQMLAGATRSCQMLPDATKWFQILLDAGWCYQYQHQCQYQRQVKCQYKCQNQLQYRYQHRYQIPTPISIPIPIPTYNQNQYPYRFRVLPKGNFLVLLKVFLQEISGPRSQIWLKLGNFQKCKTYHT